MNHTRSERDYALYRLDQLSESSDILGTGMLPSESELLSTVDAADFNYGLTAKASLPWKLQLSTDFTVYSRRGYDDEKMNTDDLVWNARLARTLLGGRATVMIDGFDMLHQLSALSYSMNAQGRTETYRNVIPRYVMLHVIYRLNIKPKGQPGK